MFHQVDNSIGGEIYNAYLYRNIEWKNHIHKAFEFTLVIDGEIKASVDGKDYILKEGEGVFVLPYQAHSLSVKGEGQMFVVVFSENFVQAFASALNSKTSKTAFLTLEPSLKEFISYALNIKEGVEGDYVAVEKPPFLLAKSALYAVCNAFFEQTELTKRHFDASLVYSILNYIENNFTLDISLTTLSKELGYDHRYLSRVFSSAFKMNFKTLVNQYRCDYAKRLVSSGSDSLSDIAFASGFQSIRSFNRAFKEIMGFYPSVLRK